jgi:hypothetical protein
VLTTYRKDGSAHTVPLWFRWNDPAVEVVIAEGDVKLGHLARNPRCVLVVFETARPFRGMEVRGVAELVEGDVTSARETVSASPPNGGPGLECYSGWSLTVRGMGPVGHPAILTNPRQQRPADARLACRCPIELLALASDFGAIWTLL